MTSPFSAIPVRVGLVGTGYAAKMRAETVNADPRAKLVGVAGHTPEATQEFCHVHQTQSFNAWADLVENEYIDLVIMSGINRDHGSIVQAALSAGKHVVVEYPLALTVGEAESAIALAKSRNLLLHVEHIELLGGVHQALMQALPQIGAPFYARYVTMTPQNPAPQKWAYHPALFGFPLIGALSRLHRLTHAFGEVATVSCQNREWKTSPDSEHYAACLCAAQLRFKSGLIAEVVYGKGEAVWQPQRKFEVQGKSGGLIFDGEAGVLINAEGDRLIEVASRRGIFARDMTAVLDCLIDGTPLYVTLEASLYALRVADAARRSDAIGQVVTM